MSRPREEQRAYRHTVVLFGKYGSSLDEPKSKENPQPRPFTVLLAVLRVDARNYAKNEGRKPKIAWDDRSHRAKRPRSERWEAGKTVGLRLSLIRNARRDFRRQHDRRVGMAYPSTMVHH